MIARIALLTLVVAVSSVYAQSEAEILNYAASGQRLIASGQLEPLEYYSELYRRLAATPSSEYRFKAENLRMIGQRVTMYEDVAAGKLTRARADRMVIEQQADWDAASRASDQAVEDAARRQRRQSDAQAQAEVDAMSEAARRRLELQMLQNMRTPTPAAVPFYQMPNPSSPRQTNCTSYRSGNTIQTDCR
jgi:hypothetical protein